MYGHFRNSPRQQRAQNATENRANRGDERALPEKKGGDVDPPVAHRTQDRDFTDLRKHRHREYIKDSEAGEEDDERDSDGGGHSQGRKNLQISFFSFLPALGPVLEESFEVAGQRRRAVGIAQFINDHRRFVRFFEETLGNSRVSVNAAGIDRAHATARNGGDIEARIIAARREQLNGVAWIDLEQSGQSISNNHAGRVVAKIVKLAK